MLHIREGHSNTTELKSLRYYIFRNNLQAKKFRSEFGGS